MPEFRYRGKRGERFDFYEDNFGQVYCVIIKGKKTFIENKEGTIEIDDINGFFREVIQIENPIETAYFGDDNSVLVRFMRSKFNEFY